MFTLGYYGPQCDNDRMQELAPVQTRREYEWMVNGRSNKTYFGILFVQET